MQVFFPSDTAAIFESKEFVSFPVTFTPLRTNIPFTFVVETFDLVTSDAIGWTCNVSLLILN